MAKINSTIFKQETIKSWFSGVGTSVNNEVIQPFQNANSVISKYNLAIQHNSLTQQGWQRLLAQSDDSLKAYLTSIKGSTASMAGYNVSLQGSITGFTKVSNAIKQYNALGTVSLKEQQAFATAVGATNAKLGSYLIGLNGSTAGLRGYGVSLVASTAKTIGLTVATTALNAAMTMGISVIVTGLISAFTAWINKSEEITEKAQEAADKINSISESLKTNTETVENAKKRYAELAQEVENLGKITQSQGTLSNEEYEEFLDLSNQLAGIFPSLTKNYDENGNAILDLSGDVNTIVGSLDDLIQKEKELANQKIMEEFPDVFKGYAQDISDAESKVKSAQTEFDKINNAYQQLSNGSTAQAFDLQGNGWFTNENGEKVTLLMGEYIANLEALGLEYEKTQLKVKNQFGGDTVSGYLVEATGDIDTAFTSKLETARENLQYAQQQLEGEKSSIDSYLNTWLQDEFSYVQIDDSGLQTAIQDMLFNFDFSNIPENKRGDWNYVSEYLRRNILFEINKVQDDPVISKAISEVFGNTELTPNEKANYLQQIQDYFGEDSSIVISLKPQIKETDTLQKQYDDAINRFAETETQTLDDVTAQYQEVIDNEYQKIQDWGLSNYAQQIKDGTIQSVFGNVDMDKRTIITWSDELKQTYKDALDSWDYDPEVGSIDTVFGGSSRFGEDLNGVGWEVAFTPILPDGTFLSQDAVYDYINTILAEAYTDDGKITEDELTKIDAQGRQIGNTFIQGIFAGIDDSQNYDNNGNWAETVGRLLHFSGDFGAVEIAKREKEKAIKEFSDSNVDLEKFFADNSINTTEEIDYWNKVTEGAESAKEAVEMYNKAKGQNPDEITVLSGISKTIDHLDKKVKPVMDSLKSAYQDIFTEDGFTLDNVGVDMLNSVKEAIAEINELDGVDVPTTAFEDFARVLTDTETTEEQAHQAFNDLVSDIITGTDSTLVSSEAFNTLVQSLEEMGVTNAEEVIRSISNMNDNLNRLANDAESDVSKVNSLLTGMGKDAVTSSNKLTECTWEEIGALTTASKTYGFATDKIQEYVAQKIWSNQNAIDTSNDIGQILVVAKSFGIATEAIARYEQVKKLADQGWGGGQAQAEALAKSAYNEILEEIKALYNFELPTPDYKAPESKNDKSSKDSSTSFDWIETSLSNMEDTLDDLDNKVADTYAKWEDRNKDLANSILKTKEAIELQRDAAKAYEDEANAVGLSSHYKTLVQKGALNIENIKDKDLADRISNYQDLYEKSIECEKKALELERTLNELSSNEKWDLFKSKSDLQIEGADNIIDYQQSLVDKAELQGLFANEDYYKVMRMQNLRKQSELKKQYAELETILNTVPKGTEAYDTLFNEWMDIRNQLGELENEFIEFNNNIRDLDWEIFEYLEDSISRITEEVDFLKDLLSDEDMFDEYGNMTKYADATMGLHFANIEVYKKQAEDYYDEMQELQEQLNNGAGDEVLQQYRDYEDAHRDAISSIRDEQNAILDLVENGLQAQLEALQKIIDKKKEAISVEKD